MTDDKKNQEKEQISANIIEKLTNAEIAAKDDGYLTPKKIEAILLESSNEAKTSTERFDFFKTAAEMEKKLVERFF